jgi:hypothetical protein
MSDRRKMQMGDWLTWIALLIVGGLLGLAIVAWVGFEEPAFLQSIIFYFIPIGFVFVFTFFLFEVAGSGLPIEVEASPTKETKKPKSLFLLVSLPVGFAIGAIWATFGLSGVLL